MAIDFSTPATGNEAVQSGRVLKVYAPHPDKIRVERYINGDTERAIADIVISDITMIQEPQRNNPQRMWVNHYADLLELGPNGEVYVNPHQNLAFVAPRGVKGSRLSASIPGFDVDEETGEVFSMEDLQEKVILRLQQLAASTPRRDGLAPATGGAFLPDDTEVEGGATA